MSILTDQLAEAVQDAEKRGGWAAYAVYHLGEVNTGDEELDIAIESLYRVNEAVHRIANKLCLRHDLPLYGGL